MEKEFVSYEQAIALKKLGFNEPSLASYETAFGRDIDFELGYIIDGPKNYVLTPLKQQVFRWFRYKYNKHSFIELVYNDGIKFDFVLYVDKKEDECINYGDGPFKTYEEAENACIDKLIELAKQY